MLRREGDNERRSERFCPSARCCALRKFHVIIGWSNTRDQIAFCAFHSFLMGVKRMLTTYMRRMRNNNLEIRIAGSPGRPQ